MLLLFLAYFGGVLTILSPCILPVLPFVFARSDQPFRKSGLPLLAGMAVTFAVLPAWQRLAVVGCPGQPVWADRRADPLCGLRTYAALLFAGRAPVTPVRATGQPALAELRCKSGILNSFLLGMGTGLLWAPCAGPILGLILPAPRWVERACIPRFCCWLCGRSRDFAGGCPARRRAGLRGDEAFSGGRGVDSPHSWRRCSCRRGGRRLWTGPRRTHPPLPGKHRRPGTAARRPLPSRSAKKIVVNQTIEISGDSSDTCRQSARTLRRYRVDQFAAAHA